MAKHEQLELTDAEFTELHRAVDKVRASSATVTVNKALFLKLLRDHSRLNDLERGFRRAGFGDTTAADDKPQPTPTAPTTLF